MNKFIVLGVGLLAGCTQPVSEDRGRKTFNDTYDIVCLNGVQYYESQRSLAPKYSTTVSGYALSQPDHC